MLIKGRRVLLNAACTAENANLGAVEGVCCDIKPLQSFVLPQGRSAVLVQQAGQHSIRLNGLSEEVGLQGAAGRKSIRISPTQSLECQVVSVSNASCRMQTAMMMGHQTSSGLACFHDSCRFQGDTTCGSPNSMPSSMPVWLLAGLVCESGSKYKAD